jgi:hypothetical protein
LINKKYHLESLHPEGDSPSPIEEGSGQNMKLLRTQGYPNVSNEDLDFFECLQDGCGEAILPSELATHIEMHDIERNETEDSIFENPHLNKRIKSSNSKPESGFNAKLPQAPLDLTDGGSPAGGSPAVSSPSNLQASTKLRWREILNMPTPKGSPEKLTIPKRTYRRLGVCTSCTSMILFSYY